MAVQCMLPQRWRQSESFQFIEKSFRGHINQICERQILFSLGKT